MTSTVQKALAAKRAATEARRRIEADDKKWQDKTNAELRRRMVGRVVVSATYDRDDAGTLRFEFDDGTVFTVSASGDDATHIGFGFERQ